LPFIQVNTNAQDFSVVELSLEEAVNLAMEYNLNLRKARIDLAASGYSESKLWAEIFPSISASARTAYSTALFSDSALFNNPGFSYGIGLGVNLTLNAGIPHSMRSIRLAHQANILRYEDASNQLAIQVTRKYFSLIAEKNNLLHLEEILNLTERQYERNQVSFRNGLIRELTLIQSRVAFFNARYTLSIANTAYANSIAEFIAMLGIGRDIDLALLGEINIVMISADAETLINQYLPDRPDIIRNKQEIERLSNAQNQLFMQSRAPSVNLSVDWNSSNFSPFSDSLRAEARLSMPIDPFIPGTSRSQALLRADDSIEKAMLDLLMTEQSAKTQIRSLTSLLHNLWDSIEIARLSLEVAQRNYELTEEGFRSGTVESLVLEDARNNMAGARQRLLQSELSYFNMMLDLSAALNINWNNLIQRYGVTNE
jgi:outer membrane protein